MAQKQIHQIHPTDSCQRYKSNSIGETSSFKQMLLEQLDIHRQKKKKNIGLSHIPCTKINSKLIKDLNVTHKTIKLLGKKKERSRVRQNVFKIWHPKHHDTPCMIWKVDKLDHLRTKTLDSVKDPGTSLMVQWLRLCAFTAGDSGYSLVQELRSHMPHGMAKNPNNSAVKIK